MQFTKGAAFRFWNRWMALRLDAFGNAGPAREALCAKTGRKGSRSLGLTVLQASGLATLLRGCGVGCSHEKRGAPARLPKES